MNKKILSLIILFLSLQCSEKGLSYLTRRLITSALLCIDNEYVAACLLREIEFGLLYRSGVLWKKEYGNAFKRFE